MLTLGFAACSPKSDSGGGISGGDGERVLTVADSSDPGTLDPWQAPSDGIHVYNETYQGLFNYEYFGSEIVGILGQGYEEVDGKTYRVKIYDNIFDTGGNQITASDVVWSYEKAIAAATWNNRVGVIDHIDIVDDYTMDFVYSVEIDREQFNDSMMIMVVDQETYESLGKDEFNAHPVATGPYYFGEYVTGSYYTLVKNEDYWKDPELRTVHEQQNVDVINFRIITDTAQVALALKSGDVDISKVDAANAPDFYDYRTETTTDGYYVQVSPGNACRGLVFNCSADSVLQDQNLRYAVCYAIDNQALIDATEGGNGEVEYTFGGNQYGGFQEAMVEEAKTNIYSYDLGKSEEYLKAAGYEKGELKLRLICGSFNERYAVALQAQLLQAGINAEVLSYDAALYEAYTVDSTQWDINLFIRGKSAGTLPAFWGHHVNGTNYEYGSANFIFDPAMEELYRKSLENDATDEDVLMVHDYITDKAYFYGLFNGVEYYVGQEGVTNVYYTDFLGIEGGSCTFTDDFFE
jgi:ABC-type transport system substrate-binding protein